MVKQRCSNSPQKRYDMLCNNQLFSMQVQSEMAKRPALVDALNSSNIVVAFKNVVLAKRAGCIHPKPFHDACGMEMMVTWQ